MAAESIHMYVYVFKTDHLELGNCSVGAILEGTDSLSVFLLSLFMSLSYSLSRK